MLPDLSGVSHLHVNSPSELISTKIAIISKIEGGGIKAMWLSIHSHMLI